MDAARNYLFPLYASLLTPWWLRILGAKVGRGTEISTALLTPKFTVVEDGAFLADDTMVASYELGGGWIHVAKATVGKRAFLGNSGITQPGRRVPDDGLVAVLSATPHKAKAGSSWLGSPPIRLRRHADDADALATYNPPTRLKVMRAGVETCRLIPVMVTFAIGVAVLAALQALAWKFGYGWAALGGGIVLLAAGAVAGGIAVGAKWLVVGRIRAGEHPLWSSFVWRNEVSDTFVETVAGPWFARAASGTPVMNLWLRALGAKIGRGVWCETYWLPEADLVTLQRAQHRQPRLRGADASVPRPDHADGHRRARGGRDAGTALRGAARRQARRRCHRRARVAGDARRRGSGVDSLAGQSDRTVGAFRARSHGTRNPRREP